MKILKRLLLGTFAILALHFIIVEVIYYAIRWVLIGTAFPEMPLCMKPVMKLIDSEL